MNDDVGVSTKHGVFTCGYCFGRFRRSRPEGEQEAEFHCDFPGQDIKEGVEICHPCYLLFQKWHKEQQPNAN